MAFWGHSEHICLSCLELPAGPASSRRARQAVRRVVRLISMGLFPRGRVACPGQGSGQPLAKATAQERLCQGPSLLHPPALLAFPWPVDVGISSTSMSQLKWEPWEGQRWDTGGPAFHCPGRALLEGRPHGFSQLVPHLVPDLGWGGVQKTGKTPWRLFSRQLQAEVTAWEVHGG